jgi:hypothetical protein
MVSTGESVGVSARLETLVSIGEPVSAGETLVRAACPV